MDRSKFQAFVVQSKTEAGAQAQLQTIGCDDLPEGELLVQIQASSLNYKDALSATGHPGISPRLPHVPGIDAVGKVVESSSDDFREGDAVYLSGRDFGSLSWGGWAEFCRAPADWAFPIPDSLTLDEVIQHGTAGFTAAQCVQAIEANGATPDRGAVVVTGATGGVGCIAIMILAKLGYEVVAVSGKRERFDWLKELGASEVIDREAISDTTGKPMLTRRWAAGVDTVGGNALTTMLRQTDYRGCVAACGLAASPKLEMTVYPFILRAVSLIGIDSAWCDREKRHEIWSLLSGRYRVDQMEQVVSHTDLNSVQGQVDSMLAGQTFGRIIVSTSASSSAAG